MKTAGHSKHRTPTPDASTLTDTRAARFPYDVASVFTTISANCTKDSVWESTITVFTVSTKPTGEPIVPRWANCWNSLASPVVVHAQSFSESTQRIETACNRPLSPLAVRPPGLLSDDARRVIAITDPRKSKTGNRNVHVSGRQSRGHAMAESQTMGASISF